MNKATRSVTQCQYGSHHVDGTPERELADDVLSVIIVFGARLYGSRSHGRRRRSS